MSVKDTLYDWNGLNAEIFRKVNGYRGGNFYDNFAALVSKVTDHHNFPYYLVFFAFVALAGYMVRKIRHRGGSQQYLASWVVVFATLIVGYGVNGGAVLSLKHHFAFPRPYVALQNENVRVLADRSDHEDDSRSFPSGHAAFTTMVVMSIWPIIPQGAGLLVLLAIPLVCWSRLVMGMHFPADVLGGVLVTLVVMTCVKIVLYPLLRKIFKLKT